MKYYIIYQDNTEEGPFNELEIEARLREGIVSSENLARRENESRWQPLSTFFPMHSESPHAWMQSSENAQSEQANYSCKEEPRQSVSEQEQSANIPFAPPQPLEKSKPPVQNFAAQPASLGNEEETLPMIAFIGGILCASFMVLGLVPCLGWINWFVLLAGCVNLVLSIIGIINAKNQNSKNKALIGLILTIIAVVIGSFRLVAGFGCV